MTKAATECAYSKSTDDASSASSRAAEIARNQQIRIFLEAQLGRNERMRQEGAATLDATCDTDPAATSDSPENVESMRARLRNLWHETETRHADLIALLIVFDEAEGWRKAGAKSCVTWMNTELDICPQLAREKLRVGYALQSLPLIAELFAAGRLGWSKVRSLTRIADADNERELAASALDMSAGACVSLCAAFRWRRRAEDREAEKAADAERFSRRSLTWRDRPDGNVEFRVVLTPEHAAAFRQCLQRSEDVLFAEADNETGLASEKGVDPATAAAAPAVSPTPPPARPTAAQRRADALVTMAEHAMHADNADIRTADRYQVVLQLDADTLTEGATTTHAASCSCDRPPVDLPFPARAVIQGRGGITAATAERISCDASLVTLVTRNGEPVSIGRKTRVWPEPMVRAIHARDNGCCQFPGCDHTRWLQVHHIVHWAHGGETSVSNGLLLCTGCHRMVHEENWRIVRLDTPGTRSTLSAAACEAMLDESTDAADSSTHHVGNGSRETVRRLKRYRPMFGFEPSATPTMVTA